MKTIKPAAPKTVAEMFLSEIRKGVRTAEVRSVTVDGDVTRIEWAGSPKGGAYVAFVRSRAGYQPGSTVYIAKSHPNFAVPNATEFCRWTA